MELDIKESPIKKNRNLRRSLPSDLTFVYLKKVTINALYGINFRFQAPAHSPDAKIPGSGLIIYRVGYDGCDQRTKTPKKLGNIAGDDYLYVFRPENRDNVSESFLSKMYSIFSS